MKKSFVLLWLIIITTTFSHSLSAAQSAQQDDLFGGDNVEAVIALAEAGDVEAQMALAQRYRFGVGVSQDSARAVEWFEKAAEQGNVQGEFSVGYMYASGENGFKKELVKAAEWFRKAAENEHSNAQANLGMMYARGDGVEKNTETALFWLQKAADQGYAPAQLEIGRLYATGDDGMPKDIEKADAMYQKIAEEGNASAQFSLALKYMNGDGVARDPKKAIELYQKAAEQGNVGAQVNLANIYAKGELTRKNLKAATELYLKAAEQGQSGAQYQIGLLYYNGKGVKKDRVAAAQWFQKAANQRDSRAQIDLGHMYIKGEGVKKDAIEGMAWLYLADSNRLIDTPFANSDIVTLEKKLGVEKTRIARRRSEEIRQSINSEISARTGVITPDVGNPIGSGAGVVISKDGLILTSSRIVAGAESIKIRTIARTVSAEILEIDTAYDIAILKCEGPLTPASVANSANIQVDDEVYAILSPRPVENFGVAWSPVQVKKLTGARKNPGYLQIGRTITPGAQMNESVIRKIHTDLLNSVSGPLLDKSFNFIGMIPFWAVSDDGFVYVLRSEVLKPLFEKYGVPVDDNLESEAEKPGGNKISGTGMSPFMLRPNSIVMILTY